MRATDDQVRLPSFKCFYFISHCNDHQPHLSGTTLSYHNINTVRTLRWCSSNGGSVSRREFQWLSSSDFNVFIPNRKHWTRLSLCVSQQCLARRKHRGGRDVWCKRQMVTNSTVVATNSARRCNDNSKHGWEYVHIKKRHRADWLPVNTSRTCELIQLFRDIRALLEWNWCLEESLSLAQLGFISIFGCQLCTVLAAKCLHNWLPACGGAFPFTLNQRDRC